MEKTTTRHIHARSIAVIVLGFLVGVAAYPNIPGDAINQMRGARAQIAFALPITMLVIHLLFRSLWRHDRIRTGNGAFEATYQAIVFRTILFVFGLNALVMILLTDAMDAVGVRTWGGRSVIVLLGLTIAAIGNLLPRTRPNVAFGVRTEQTLANAQLWQQVHRVGGYLAVGLGILTTLAGLIARPMAGFSFVFLAAILAGMITFVTYRKYANA
jgi:hypothetical protein